MCTRRIYPHVMPGYVGGWLCSCNVLSVIPTGSNGFVVHCVVLGSCVCLALGGYLSRQMRVEVMSLMAWKGHRPGDITRQQRRRVRARRYCQWRDEHGRACDVEVLAGTGGVDHKIPLSEGGGSEDSNLWLLCDDHHNPKTRAEHKRGRQRFAARGRFDPGDHPAYLLSLIHI